MIIEDQGVLFIHCPKTAGDSIEFLLRQLCSTEKCKLRIGRHQPLSFFMQRGYTPSKIFTVVRNPFSRLVSVYNHYKFNTPFSNFIRSIPYILYGNLPQKTLTPFKESNQHHPCRRVEFDGVEIEPITIEPFQFWVSPKDLDRVRVLRFERIAEDWESFKGEIGIEAPLPHRNRNPKSGVDYRSYYTPKDIMMVQKVYKWELERFNYAF